MQMDRRIKQAATRAGTQEFARCENQITISNLTGPSLITSILETKILDVKLKEK